MRYIFYIALGIILTLYLLLYIFNDKILGAECLAKMHFLVNVVAPPTDLYKPLINSEINISDKGKIYTYNYKHKYIGTYDIGIYLDNYSDKLQFVSKDKRYKLKLKLEIKLFYKDKVYLTKVLEENYSPFSGASGSGFSLMYYKCPLDLPVNQDITCEVKVIESDDVLSNNYGPVKFYIQKISDK